MGSGWYDFTDCSLSSVYEVRLVTRPRLSLARSIGIVKIGHTVNIYQWWKFIIPEPYKSLRREVKI